MNLKAYNLKEEIEYNNDTFKNKVIINKENGSRITVFALKKEQTIPTHHSDLEVFVYVIEGSVEFRVDEKNHIINKEEFFTIPQKIPHSVCAKEDSKFIVIRL